MPLVIRVCLVSMFLLAACAGFTPPPRPRPEPMSAPQRLIEAYYERVNREDLRGVLALFDAEPTLSEPFSDPGDLTERHGYGEVAEFFAEAFARGGTDRIVPEYITPRGNRVVSGWSISSARDEAFSGTTRFTLRNGLISRMEIRLRR